MEDDNKTTDTASINAPETNKEASETPNTISKHGSTITAPRDDKSDQTVNTNPEVQGENPSPAKISKMGVDVKPPPTPPEQPQENLEAKDKPEKPEPKPEAEELKIDPEELKTAKHDGFEASDSLPDENDIKTTEATDEMQAPKIYDTKEYFVPIKNTTHSHGHIGTIIAGIISAIIVLGAIAFMAFIFY